MAIVLCIDDEAALREYIIEELQDAGYDTLVAKNGQEGLDLIIQKKPDLVLCDITMPIMDGHKVLQELREKHPELNKMPFVFLSALSDHKDVAFGKELGATAYLTKPVDFDQMLNTVKQYL